MSQNCPFGVEAYEQVWGKMSPRSPLSAVMPTSKWFGQLHKTISFSLPITITSPLLIIYFILIWVPAVFGRWTQVHIGPITV